MSPSGPATHGRIIASTFRPHPLLRNAHVQTIAPALLRPLPTLDRRVERIELPDGDFVDVAWSGPPGADRPIAILLHGLGGGLDSGYMLGLGRLLTKQGWRVCALQQRGAGPEPNRLPRVYNHGLSSDLRHVWSVLRQREPDSFLTCVGWSLGGNVLLKALAEEGSAAPISLACAVSVPFNLSTCELHLRNGFARVYQHRLLSACKDMVRRKHGQASLAEHVDVDAILAAKNFSEFDDAFTAPLNEYLDSQDYYARAACGEYLSDIRTPTLILHALDDPFMAPGIVPSEAALSPFVDLELAERGGHVGFIAANAAGLPYCWSEHHISRLLVQAFGRATPDDEIEGAPA